MWSAAVGLTAPLATAMDLSPLLDLSGLFEITGQRLAHHRGTLRLGIARLRTGEVMTRRLDCLQR